MGLRAHFWFGTRGTRPLHGLQRPPVGVSFFSSACAEMSPYKRCQHGWRGDVASQDIFDNFAMDVGEPHVAAVKRMVSLV